MHPSMVVQWLFVLIASGAILTPNWAVAQCAFNQPTGSTTYTGYLSTSLVRAFVSCNNPGGNTPNATTAGTVPSCYPAENYSQQAGSPPNGWEFHPGTSYGRVTIKRTSGGANLAGYPPTARDALITLKMYHIGDTGGGNGFASGTGNMQILFRATMNDYTYGDMTVIDFPLGLPIQLSGGSGTVSRKLGDIMKDDLHLPRFPDCTSIELISVSVRDPNGNVFATSGVKFP